MKIPYSIIYAQWFIFCKLSYDICQSLPRNTIPFIFGKDTFLIIYPFIIEALNNVTETAVYLFF